MSNTSFHSKKSSITLSKLSAEKMVTTWTAEATGQYCAGAPGVAQILLRRRQSQPCSSASRTASERLRVPVLAIAADR